MRFENIGEDGAAALSRFARPIWNDTYGRIENGGGRDTDFYFQRFLSPRVVRGMIRDGYVYGYVEDDSENPLGIYAYRRQEDGTLYISKLYLSRSARGKGVGRSAVDYMLGKGREMGCKRAHLDVNAENAPAIRAYESYGFRRGGESYVFEGGRHYTKLVMERGI